MKHGSDPDACWIESLENGWLFLVPGWLLAVGATAEALLGSSRVIAAEIARVRRQFRRVSGLRENCVTPLRPGVAGLRDRGDGLRSNLRRRNRACHS